MAQSNKPSQSDIESRMLSKYSSIIGETPNDNDPVVVVLRSLAPELAHLYSFTENQLLSETIPTFAVGSQLDDLGNRDGYPRLDPIKAQADLQVTKSDPTVVVPGGTQVTVGGQIFVTTSDETSDEFSVEAVEAKGGLVAPVSGQFITPIVGVNAQFDVVGFRPGRDLESDDAYRARLTTVGAKPRGYGLENDWIAWCKEFSSAIVGVSVFGTSGQVFLYPVVNNRPDGIPSDEDVTALQNWLNTYRNVIGVVSVTVIKPEVVSVPVVIADLDPDTVAIRSNIEALLTKYFAENTKTGQIVSVSTLYAQIGLIDELKIGGTFKITSPANDVVLSQIQLADFGGVTYA